MISIKYYREKTFFVLYKQIMIYFQLDFLIPYLMLLYSTLVSRVEVMVDDIHLAMQWS